MITQRDFETEGKDPNGLIDDGMAQKLEVIYKRLEFIDAYTAESRAASILAVGLYTL